MLPSINFGDIVSLLFAVVLGRLSWLARGEDTNVVVLVVLQRWRAADELRCLAPAVCRPPLRRGRHKVRRGGGGIGLARVATGQRRPARGDRVRPEGGVLVGNIGVGVVHRDGVRRRDIDVNVNVIFAKRLQKS